MIQADKFSDKEIIYLCRNNPKIRSIMAIADEFNEVEKEVKRCMNISDHKLKAIEDFWDRNYK